MSRRMKGDSLNSLDHHTSGTSLDDLSQVNGSRIASTDCKLLKKAALFGWPDWIERIYGNKYLDKLAAHTRLHAHIVEDKNFGEHAPFLGDLEVIFSTWGMPCLTPEQLDCMPSLRAVFFAGGSVQNFARPLLERGITVVSAWQANAVPVAEFTLAQILLAAKGYFRNTSSYKSPQSRESAFRGHGNFGETVAILGAGAIGGKVIELLRPFNLSVIVFDPFLSEERAALLGVEKVSLQAAFERGYVVSNHLAGVPETEKLLTGDLLACLRPDATFINTGRGETADETAMTRVLQMRPDITALLDVTDPEPPSEGSLLYSLPNVHLTTHIAGSMGNELVRMADYCFEEFIAWDKGIPLKYAVSLPMLKTMA
jgi:phosphoglycerate dehydrogenase-like enzyme